jgi:DNA-binding CsgD family transcriptional regulator
MLEMLRAVAAHDSYRQAAKALGASPQTVANTMKTMRRRLQVATNAQALAKVGWLRLPE